MSSRPEKLQPPTTLPEIVSRRSRCNSVHMPREIQIERTTVINYYHKWTILRGFTTDNCFMCDTLAKPRLKPSLEHGFALRQRITVRASICRRERGRNRAKMRQQRWLPRSHFCKVLIQDLKHMIGVMLHGILHVFGIHLSIKCQPTWVLYVQSLSTLTYDRG